MECGKTMNFKKVGIVGGGAWGTALSTVCQRAGLDTLLWAYEEEVSSDINSAHENKVFLPGVPIDENIKATSDLKDMADRDFLLLVVPTQFTRNIVSDLAQHISSEVPLVICSKGIETKTGMLLSEVLDEIVPDNPLAALSGPSFAADVARGKPTAVTIASENKN